MRQRAWSPFSHTLNETVAASLCSPALLAVSSMGILAPASSSCMASLAIFAEVTATSGEEPSPSIDAFQGYSGLILRPLPGLISNATVAFSPTLTACEVAVKANCSLCFFGVVFAAASEGFEVSSGAFALEVSEDAEVSLSVAGVFF